MDQELYTDLLVGNWQTLLHVGAARILHILSPDGSTFLHEMTSWPPSWKYDIISDSVNRAYLLEEQSCQIFCPDPIWNDGVLGFL